MSVTTYLSTSCQVLSICILHLVIINNIEQWGVDSDLWHFLKAGKGGLSARPPPPPPPWMGHFWASYSLLVWYGIPVHVAVKLICLTIGLWIFLSKDNVLLLLQYDMGGPSAFGVCIFIYALVFPDIFLLKSEDITLFYDSVDQGGPSAFESQWHQWTVKRSLCALAVLTWGGHLPLVSTCVLYALVFPYIFLLVDCFEWALIGDIEKCTVHSVLWQFWRGGVHLPLVSTCFLYALVFPYIFLLVDCFEWALIGNIEKHRVHSGLLQFWLGGGQLSDLP